MNSIKERVTVLEDEGGGGVVCTIGRYHNVFSLGYVSNRTLKIKEENPLTDEYGQLYFEFMNNPFNCLNSPH